MFDFDVESSEENAMESGLESVLEKFDSNNSNNNNNNNAESDKQDDLFDQLIVEDETSPKKQKNTPQKEKILDNVSEKQNKTQEYISEKKKDKSKSHKKKKNTGFECTFLPELNKNHIIAHDLINVISESMSSSDKVNFVTTAKDIIDKEYKKLKSDYELVTEIQHNCQKRSTNMSRIPYKLSYKLYSGDNNISYPKILCESSAFIALIFVAVVGVFVQYNIFV